VIRQTEPERFQRAALRWLARFCLERRDATLAQIQAAAWAFDNITDEPAVDRARSCAGRSIRGGRVRAPVGEGVIGGGQGVGEQAAFEVAVVLFGGGDVAVAELAATKSRLWPVVSQLAAAVWRRACSGIGRRPAVVRVWWCHSLTVRRLGGLVAARLA
jgi:hypothetical protein